MIIHFGMGRIRVDEYTIWSDEKERRDGVWWMSSGNSQGPRGVRQPLVMSLNFSHCSSIACVGFLCRHDSDLRVRILIVRTIMMWHLHNNPNDC